MRMGVLVSRVPPTHVTPTHCLVSEITLLENTTATTSASSLGSYSCIYVLALSCSLFSFFFMRSLFLLSLSLSLSLAIRTLICHTRTRARALAVQRLPHIGHQARRPAARPPSHRITLPTHDYRGSRNQRLCDAQPRLTLRPAAARQPETRRALASQPPQRPQRVAATSARPA